MRLISIIVIDAPCGAGKTSWAVQTINSHPNWSYIFCTPLLDEIERIRRCCGNYQRFHAPKFENGRKLNGFHRLLAEGTDIAVTHATFLNATEETMQCLSDGNYYCILDETADNVIMEFNSIQTVEGSPRQLVNQDDIQLLLDDKIKIDPVTYKVTWIGAQGGDHKFSEVERLANLGRLYCANMKLLVAVFPPEMFRRFSELYILTYRFESSMMKYYFDLFGIKYEKRSLAKSEGQYSLVPYDSLADYEFRRNLKSLVTVYDGALNRPRRTMTSTWYKNANKEAIKSLKNDIRNYFQHVVKATATKDEIAWTCIAGRQNDLKGNGYVRVRKLTPDESRLPKEQREQRERELNCFVACNAIATNAFRHRWALAYCVDIRHNPMIAGWLEKQHILVDEESFSLSCFLQWLCRSRVRDGLPVQIYIPSARIRELFSRYLSETDEAKAA